jgi:hypothetical protein
MASLISMAHLRKGVVSSGLRPTAAIESGGAIPGDRYDIGTYYRNK